MDFVKECCEPPEDETEWMVEHTLYAHYRRWSFLNDLQPMKLTTFRNWLARRERKSTIVNGLTVWELGLLDKRQLREREADNDHERSRVVKARVRVTKPQNFVNGVLEPGTELDWMTPSRKERRDLDELYQRQVKNNNRNPTTWLVVVWLGKRRLIPADAVERLA